MKNNVYKWPLIFALILHFGAFTFLFIKFTSHSHYVISPHTTNIINAAVVNYVKPKPHIQKQHHKPAKLAIKKPKPRAKNHVRAIHESPVIMQQQIIAEQKQMQVQAQQMQGEINKYKTLILQAISQYWITPPNLPQSISCQLLVHVAPGGEVLSVDLTQSSGNAALDRSAKTAVLKASTLPVPKDPDLFDNFRLIRLTVRPEGVF